MTNTTDQPRCSWTPIEARMGLIRNQEGHLPNRSASLVLPLEWQVIITKAECHRTALKQAEINDCDIQVTETNGQLSDLPLGEELTALRGRQR